MSQSTKKPEEAEADRERDSLEKGYGSAYNSSRGQEDGAFSLEAFRIDIEIDTSSVELQCRVFFQGGVHSRDQVTLETTQNNLNLSSPRNLEFLSYVCLYAYPDRNRNRDDNL